MAPGALSVLGVDHVAIAVEDLEAALSLYEGLLGPQRVERIDFPPQQVRVAILHTGAGAKIELMEGTGPDSPVSKFVADRGPGLHHVCYAVVDLKAALAEARTLGLRPLSGGEEIGVEGRPVAFLHPKATGGVLTELIQASGETTP